MRWSSSGRSSSFVRAAKQIAGFWCLIAFTCTACVGPRYVRTPSTSQSPHDQSNGIANHLVLISVDGLRPDAHFGFRSPNTGAANSGGELHAIGHNCCSEQDTPFAHIHVNGAAAERSRSFLEHEFELETAVC